MRLNKLKNFYLLLIIVLTGFLLYSCKPEVPDQDNNSILVGVFNGEGASTVCVIETMETLKIDSGITAREISGADIMNGALSQLDVLIYS